MEQNPSKALMESNICNSPTSKSSTVFIILTTVVFINFVKVSRIKGEVIIVAFLVNSLERQISKIHVSANGSEYCPCSELM